MKSTTISVLAITAAPLATFVVGLNLIAPEAAFAVATSLAIVAFSIDDLFLRPSRSPAPARAARA